LEQEKKRTEQKILALTDEMRDVGLQAESSTKLSVKKADLAQNQKNIEAM